MIMNQASIYSFGIAEALYVWTMATALIESADGEGPESQETVDALKLMSNTRCLGQRLKYDPLSSIADPPAEIEL